MCIFTPTQPTWLGRLTGRRPQETQVTETRIFARVEGSTQSLARVAMVVPTERCVGCAAWATSTSAPQKSSATRLLEWAQLLRRIYLVDVLACPCGGRRAIVGDISERDVVVAILAHKGLATEAPPRAKARHPGFDST